MRSSCNLDMDRFTIQTKEHTQLADITSSVRDIVGKSGVKEGICVVYVPHATAAITINENADPQLPLDILDVLDRLVPRHGQYRHDRIDNNAAAHVKAAIIGPSETVPIIDGKLALGTWQNIFLCDFDGPRDRTVLVSCARSK